MKQINKIFDKKNIAALLYIVIICGAAFMLLPEKKPQSSEEQVTEESTYDQDIRQTEKRLEDILSMCEGAGKVKVMLTYKNKGSLAVAENRNTSENREGDSIKSDANTEVVFNGEKEPVILSRDEPAVEGVVIVAEGGGNIQVKDSLTKAAQALTGVEPYKIEVLKMKMED